MKKNQQTNKYSILFKLLSTQTGVSDRLTNHLRVAEAAKAAITGLMGYGLHGQSAAAIVNSMLLNAAVLYQNLNPDKAPKDGSDTEPVKKKEGWSEWAGRVTGYNEWRQLSKLDKQMSRHQDHVKKISKAYQMGLEQSIKQAMKTYSQGQNLQKARQKKKKKYKSKAPTRDALINNYNSDLKAGKGIPLPDGIKINGEVGCFIDDSIARKSIAKAFDIGIDRVKAMPGLSLGETAYLVSTLCTADQIAEIKLMSAQEDPEKGALEETIKAVFGAVSVSAGFNTLSTMSALISPAQLTWWRELGAGIAGLNYKAPMIRQEVAKTVVENLCAEYAKETQEIIKVWVDTVLSIGTSALPLVSVDADGQMQMSYGNDTKTIRLTVPKQGGLKIGEEPTTSLDLKVDESSRTMRFEGDCEVLGDLPNQAEKLPFTHSCGGAVAPHDIIDNAASTVVPLPPQMTDSKTADGLAPEGQGSEGPSLGHPDIQMASSTPDSSWSMLSMLTMLPFTHRLGGASLSIPFMMSSVALGAQGLSVSTLAQSDADQKLPEEGGENRYNSNDQTVSPRQVFQDLLDRLGDCDKLEDYITQHRLTIEDITRIKEGALEENILHVFAEENPDMLVRLIEKHGLTKQHLLSSQDRVGRNVLNTLARYNADMLETLLDPKFGVTIQDLKGTNNGQTPSVLSCLAQYNPRSLATLTLSYGLSIQDLITVKNFYERPALHIFAKSEPNSLETLINENVLEIKHLTDFPNNKGQSVLHYFVKYHADMVGMLIKDHGLDIQSLTNLKDNFGESVLDCMAQSNPNALEALVTDHGLPIQTFIDLVESPLGNYFIHELSNNNPLMLARLAKDHGLPLEHLAHSDRYQKKTVLHVLAQQAPEMLYELVKKGILPPQKLSEIKDYDGHPLINYLIWDHKETVVKLITDCGLPIDYLFLKIPATETVLVWLATKQIDGLGELIKDHGLTEENLIENTDQWGNPVSNILRRKNPLQLATFVLDYGLSKALLFEDDDDSQSVLHWLAEHKPSMLEALLEIKDGITIEDLDETRDAKGNSVLHTLAKDSPHILEGLLKKYRFKMQHLIKFRIDEDNSLLRFLAEYHPSTLVMLLINNSLSIQELVNIKPIKRECILHVLAEDYPDILETLIVKHGLPIDHLKTFKNYRGDSILRTLCDHHPWFFSRLIIKDILPIQYLIDLNMRNSHLALHRLVIKETWGQDFLEELLAKENGLTIKDIIESLDENNISLFSRLARMNHLRLKTWIEKYGLNIQELIDTRNARNQNVLQSLTVDALVMLKDHGLKIEHLIDSKDPSGYSVLSHVRKSTPDGVKVIAEAYGLTVEELEALEQENLNQTWLEYYIVTNPKSSFAVALFIVACLGGFAKLYTRYQQRRQQLAALERQEQQAFARLQQIVLARQQQQVVLARQQWQSLARQPR